MTTEAINFDFSSSSNKVGTSIRDATFWVGRQIKTGFIKFVDIIKNIWDKVAKAFSEAYSFLVANPHIGIPVAVLGGLFVIGAAIVIILLCNKPKSNRTKQQNNNSDPDVIKEEKNSDSSSDSDSVTNDSSEEEIQNKKESVESNHNDDTDSHSETVEDTNSEKLKNEVVEKDEQKRSEEQ